MHVDGCENKLVLAFAFKCMLPGVLTSQPASTSFWRPLKEYEFAELLEYQADFAFTTTTATMKRRMTAAIALTVAISAVCEGKNAVHG